jgi:hypothetical protein
MREMTSHTLKIERKCSDFASAAKSESREIAALLILDRNNRASQPTAPISSTITTFYFKTSAKPLK